MQLGVFVHIYWQVQKHLQLRIEAQGKYMQSILEIAYQTLAGENLKAPNGAHHHPHHQANIIPQDFGLMPLNTNFSSFQELNIYNGGGSDQLDLHQFMPSNNSENLCVGMKNKRPLIWDIEDLRLHQDIGTASSCLDNDPFKEALSMDRGSENIGLDPILEIYDTKPLLQGDTLEDNNNKKLERPSPRRADQRMSPMISTGAPF